MYRQLMIDGDKKFMLGSSTYQYNAKQLVLSDQTVKTLASKGRLDPLQESMVYNNVYTEILDKVNQYFSLYDMNKFRHKLNLGFSKFISFPNHNVFDGNTKVSSGKREILQEILNGLHANPTFGNLKDVGITTPFGQLQQPNGILLSDEAEIRYQSPTGLFERTVSLKDL